jgi:hypothetical protein
MNDAGQGAKGVAAALQGFFSIEQILSQSPPFSLSSLLLDPVGQRIRLYIHTPRIWDYNYFLSRY